MSPIAINQRQLETLSQLLIAGGHHDVSELLSASLERLVAFWPAQAGALLYMTPYGETVRLMHGTLDDHFEAWFLTADTEQAAEDGHWGEPMTSVSTLGYGREWPAPPRR